MQIKVSYITANEIMEILGIGRSKAYDIVREMNQELENAGYNVIKGKVPVRYFQKKVDIVAHSAYYLLCMLYMYTCIVLKASYHL